MVNADKSLHTTQEESMSVPGYPLQFYLCCILPFFGGIGNVFLFGFALRRRKYYHMTSIELLIALLSCCNLFKIGLYFTVADAAYYKGDWTNGALFCNIVSKLGAVAYLMSEFIIIFITKLNFRIVAKSHFGVDMSLKRVSYACLVAAIAIAGIMSIPGFYDWHVMSYEVWALKNSSATDLGNCTELNGCIGQRNLNLSCCVLQEKHRMCELNFELWFMTYIIMAALIICSLPIAYFIFVTLMLRHKLRNLMKNVRHRMNSVYYRIRVKDNNRLFIVLASTSIGFIISYVPLTLLHFINHFSENQSIKRKMVHLYSWYTFLLFVLTSVDTCSTPFAYLAFNPSFRRMLYKIVCCCCFKRKLKRRQAVKLKQRKEQYSTSSTFTLKSTL